MNTYFAVTCLLASAAVAFGSAIPPATLSYVPITTVDHIPSSNYGFNYAVNDPSTGDNKAQWETRHGDVVKGAYSLVEPDGHLRVVEYHADPHTGFNAVVKRTGANVHSFGLLAAKPVIDHGPILPIAPIAPVAKLAPIGPIAPILPIAPIAKIAPVAPIIDVVHRPIITPVIPALEPWLPILPAPAPWVHLSGSSYGHQGNIDHHWAAGPFSLDGKTLTVRTKHH